MTEKKTKDTKKPTVKRTVNPDRVAVLETHVGERLVIRSNPSPKAVKEFVIEQNRRYAEGEPGGPSGLPPFQIHEANFYPSEADIDSPQKATKIKL